MGRGFSAPSDLQRVVPELRNLDAQLRKFRSVARLVGAGTTEERVAALEAKVNDMLARLKAVVEG